MDEPRDLETMLVLGAEPPTLARRQLEVWSADSPLTAARLFTQGSPRALLVGPARWAWRFVRRMPAHLRPAVIAVGAEPNEAARLADEWVPSPTDASLSERLGLALARAELRQTLARRALVDPLTGVGNRRAVLAALRKGAFFARRANHPLSLILFDLEGFGRLNREQGQPAGDALLRRVGSILRRQTRRSEAVGRLGGDSFALVLSGDLEAARAAVRRLEAGLDSVGTRAAWACAQLLPNERLGELFLRADAELATRIRA